MLELLLCSLDSFRSYMNYNKVKNSADDFYGYTYLKRTCSVVNHLTKVVRQVSFKNNNKLGVILFSLLLIF